MSQEAVERLLGRLITDARFRKLTAHSLELACRQEGYPLSPVELRLLSTFLALQPLAELGDQLDPGLCRAVGETS
jgi:hypothetical protein